MAQRRGPKGKSPAQSGARDGRATVGRPRAARIRAATRASHQPAARTDGRSTARSATRPAAARRPITGATATRTRAPQPGRFTGRATILGLILLALALAYAYPVRVYLSQQAEISRMEASQTSQRQRIENLLERLSKWDDDEYVIAQARRRLDYVRPGEVAYVIVENPPPPKPTDGGKAADTGPWFSQLWSNIQAADNPRER